jgi:hypothetical protein
MSIQNQFPECAPDSGHDLLGRAGTDALVDD